MPAAASPRHLLIGGGMVLLLVVVGAVVLTRPAAPAGPLDAEGHFPVSVPRTVENVDPCGLLTEAEAAALVGRAGPVWAREPGRCTLIGAPGRTLDIVVTGNALGHTEPGYGPNTTIAGHPAVLGVPTGYPACIAVVVLEPEPSRHTLTLQWLTDPDCESLRGAAELIIPRLPLAAG